MRLAAIIPLAVLAVGTEARAEERAREPTLAERGAFVVSFERLFGYSIEGFGRRFEVDDASQNLGVGSFLGPRIGIYGIARGGFTAGGFVGTFGFIDNGRLRDTATLAGPRLGWLFTSPVIGVWPRVGFTWLILGRGRDELVVSYAVEVPLTVQLTRHAGLTVGPSLEVPTSRDTSPTYTSLALTAGLFGAL